MFVQLSASDVNNCAIRYDGTAACWGNNDHGQSSPPAEIFSQVSNGRDHTCGIKSDGSLVCWGWDEDGQSTPPVGLFIQISAGRRHTCGIKIDGVLICWGQSIYGQSPTIAISPSALPNGSIGVQYTESLIASGGTEPYSFQLIEGNMPPGLTLTPEGQITGTPTLGGSFEFTIQALDSYPIVGSQSYVLRVDAPPTANDQSIDISEDMSIDIVLTADDVNGDELSWYIGQPAHGSLSGSAPNLTYTPESNWNGTDNFTFHVSDGLFISNTATVTITILPVNDAPTATDDVYIAIQNTILEIESPGVLLNDADVDGDYMTAALLSPPTHGVISLAANGSFIYTPYDDFTGTDSFTYLMSTYPGLLSDWTDDAAVTITVLPGERLIFLPTILK